MHRRVEGDAQPDGESGGTGGRRKRDSRLGDAVCDQRPDPDSELPWTVTFHDNMSNSQILLEQHRNGAAVEKELKEFLAELESWYVKVCRAGSDMEYQAAIEVPEKSEKDPEKYQAAIKSLRLLVCSDANDVDEDTGKGDPFTDMFAPKEIQILSRRRPNIGIALQVRAGFRTFPGSRDALLEDMKKHYGLSFEKLKIALVGCGETTVIHIDTVW